MIQRRWQLFFIFLFSFQATAEAGSISLKDALETRGTVIMFRHALAP